MTSPFEVYITHKFHGTDNSHGFVGEIDLEGKSIASFVNHGNDRFSFEWADGDSYMGFLRDGLAKYPTMEYRDVVKQHLLDLLVAQEELCM